jgi:hypothetical protein
MNTHTHTHMITVNESVTKIIQMNYQHKSGVLHIPVLHIKLYDIQEKIYETFSKTFCLKYKIIGQEYSTT